MAEEIENKTASSKLSSFLEKNKKGALAFVAVIVLVIIGLVVFENVKNASADKNLAVIDDISYTLTNGSGALEESELQARRDDAITNLIPYTKKSGVAAVRANMLSADLYYQMDKYEDAIEYWKAAANKGKTSYTAPICYYNIASAYEMLKNVDEAVNYYKKAADTTDFVLRAHAKFSYGRVLETKGDVAGAIAAYKELNDDDSGSTWANLAKTRIIALEASGKAE